MLASSGALPGADESWAYEFKWDGVRAITYSQPGSLRLESRNLNDITGRYPELAGLNAALGSHRVVLDGEIVCFDANGQPSFAALQHRMHIASEAKARQLAQTSPVTYVIFDVLWLDGHSLMGQPYGQRRQRLAALGLQGEHWRIPDHVVGGGGALLAASASQQLEGIIAKRLDSRYEPGRRSGAWVKIKNIGRQEFVIGGWMPGEGRRTARIGALLLGVSHEAGGLRYVGRVSTGFREQGPRPARPPDGPARARRLAVFPWRAAAAPRRGVLRRGARLRGGVHRVDPGRPAAPPLLQGTP